MVHKSGRPKIYFNITIALRRDTRLPPVNLEPDTQPQGSQVKYLRFHFCRKMTWNEHIKSKRTEIKTIWKPALASWKTIHPISKQ